MSERNQLTNGAQARVMVRFARVEGNVSIGQVRAYLPSNYKAELFGDVIIIGGRDDHGWTLDGYVIPRLASGLIVAKEWKS